jgi:hypothetical protein
MIFMRFSCVKKNFNMINNDGLAKSCHTREGGYPRSKQLPEKSGFPFSPTVGALKHGNDKKCFFRVFAT